MILRLHFCDTLYEIAHCIDKDLSDTEALRLLDLVVFSVFYDEVSYKEERVQERINRLLHDLSIMENDLDQVFNTLHAEVAQYLPSYRSYQSAHCFTKSCIQKTSRETYTLLLNRSKLQGMCSPKPN